MEEEEVFMEGRWLLEVRSGWRKRGDRYILDLWREREKRI